MIMPEIVMGYIIWLRLPISKCSVGMSSKVGGYVKPYLSSDIVRILYDTGTNTLLRSNGEAISKCSVGMSSKVGGYVKPYLSSDIVRILYDTGTNTLLRSNGDKVATECLRGKAVLILFSKNIHWYRAKHILSIVEAYVELSPKGVFEVVFVAGADDDGDVFSDTPWLYMPWLAIPSSDTCTREHLHTLFHDSVLIDASSKILLDSWYNIRMLFLYKGVDWDPMRGVELYDGSECEAFKKDISVKNFLATSSRNYVISNDGRQVPISELDEKVVGVYMFGEMYGQLILDDLLKIYKELVEEKGEKFEIVFVNLHFRGGYQSEKTFKQKLGKMPWKALPFGDRQCRKLWRNFSDEVNIPPNHINNIFLIIDPIRKTLETNAAYYVREYGIRAYPFMRQDVFDIESKRLRAVRLESLLKEAGCHYVNRRTSGDDEAIQVSVSELVGKSILLLFSCRMKRTCELLPDWYMLIKEKDEAFEVMVLCPCGGDHPTPEMPRLEVPRKCVHPVIMKHLGVNYCHELIAFGPNGCLRAINANIQLNLKGASAYPFEDDINKEAFNRIYVKPFSAV